MAEKPLILDLIVAEEIEDTKKGPRIDQFNYGFIIDFLSPEDENQVFEHECSESYGIIKKRRSGEEGRSPAYFAIPYIIEGQDFMSMTCPSLRGEYTDEELHNKLPGALRKINEEIRQAGARGLVLATEEAEAKIVRETFSQLGYDVHEFKRVKK